MRPLNEVKPPFYEYSVPEYAELTGEDQQTIRRRCAQGRLDAYRTSDAKGSHWMIKVRPDDVVTRDEYERILKENAALKSRLEGIHKMAAI